jgi:endogenous inhibitor of DNA gyrase (YacG/DUF329 family)
MTIVKCPTCERRVEYENNEFRPFCSERCKLLDLGAWADERYAVPAASEPLSDDDVTEIENALKKDSDP